MWHLFLLLKMIHSKNRMTGVTSLVCYLITVNAIIKMRSVIISMQQGHMRGVLPPSVSIETCINWCLWAHNSSLFCKWPCPCHIGHAAAATWISADLKCPYWLFEARILHCFLWELLYGLRLELLWTLFLYSVRADRGVLRPYRSHS